MCDFGAKSILKGGACHAIIKYSTNKLKRRDRQHEGDAQTSPVERIDVNNKIIPEVYKAVNIRYSTAE
jgi:hypothetical protein